MLNQNCSRVLYAFILVTVWASFFVPLGDDMNVKGVLECLMDAQGAVYNVMYMAAGGTLVASDEECKQEICEDAAVSCEVEIPTTASDLPSSS